MVARSRGCTFRKEDGQPMNMAVCTIADDAMDDVAMWLGFESAQRYLRALPRERRRIFRRAKDTP